MSITEAILAVRTAIQILTLVVALNGLAIFLALNG